MKIPPGWRKASLGNLTPADRKIVYGIVQAGPHMPDGIPYIRSTDVGGDLIAGDLLRTTPAIADKYNRSRVRPGDIIFSLRGNIGETSIVPLGLDGANLTQGTARISLNGEIDNHFVRYALAEYHVRKRINVTAKGSTFREITIEDLRNIEIPLAPFQEQRQISKIICCCDSAIKTNEAIIAAQVERKRGLMQQLLTGQTRFKEFKEEKWRTHRLGDLFTERVEIGRVDLALVAITGQNGVVPRDSLAKRDTSSEDKSKYLRIAPGDIGYNTMRMWQGVAGLSKIEGIVSPAYTICIPSDRIDGQFAAYLFKHAAVINLFRRYSQGLGNRVACVMNECKNTQQNQGNHEVCPELRTTDLIPQCDTVSMKAQKAESKSLWTKAPVANLIRYEPSGIYFVHAKVRGKLVRKSLETNVLSVAKQRLGDVLDAEQKALAPKNAKIVGKMTFGQALGIFEERQKQSTEIKPRSKEYNERAAKNLLKTWSGLAETDVKKITKADCLQWRADFGRKYAATVTNGTLSILRRVLDIAMEAGVRYDNPAKAKEVRRARVRQKELILPEPDQFVTLVNHVRGNGSGKGGPCADAIQFFAYAGPRLNEAKHIFGRDCNFTKGEIIIRGDAETGTKNWEIRRVPMIPEMRKLLERLKEKRGEETFLNSPVCVVRKFNRSLKNACKKLGLHHLTHHDLRHLFATRCIESGVPIPTVAKWLGHKDGGVLAMQTYGHLRDKHSSDMALKVIFAEGTPTPPPTPAPVPATVVPLPPQGKSENHATMDHQKKSVAKAKAKYKYPWWASSNPMEIFWGQVNEEVQIVPAEKYHEAAKAAMNREVLSDEFADPEGLRDEFIERAEKTVVEQLLSKIPQVEEDEKRMAVC